MNRILCIASCLALALSTYAADTAALLKPYPGKTQKIVREANVAIVKGGEAVIKDICKQILPNDPKTDRAVRFALNSVVLHVTRAGADAERAMVTKALCDALPTLTSNEAKFYVIDLLERCGKNDAIPALTPFISDADLCEPAIHTLIEIGTPEADVVLAKSLGSAKGIAQIKLMHALGARRYAPATTELLALAKSSDATVSRAALDALTTIGASDATSVIIAATADVTGRELTHAVGRCQRLGNSLAASGKTSEAEELFRHILAQKSDSNDISSGWQCIALTGLVKALGDKATDDLIKAIPNVVDNRVAFKISSLALTLSTATADKVHAVLAKEDPFYGYRLLSVKAAKGDAASATALLNALVDDAKNRDRIYPYARVCKKADIAKALITLMANGGKRMVEWPLEIPGPILHPQMIAAWKQAGERQREAFIEIATIRKSLDFEEQLLADMDHESSTIRTAASKALGDMESPKAVAKLALTYTKAADRRERVKALRIIADFCKKSGNLTALTSLMTTPESHKEICPFLASIGGRASLAKVASLLTSSDAVIKEAATRALLKWQSEGAIPNLLKLAKETAELKYNVMAIGTVTRLAAKQRGTKGLHTLNAAYALTKRPEEKKAIESARYNLVMSKNVRNKLRGKDADLVKAVYAQASADEKTKMKKKFGKLLK